MFHFGTFFQIYSYKNIYAVMLRNKKNISGAQIAYYRKLHVPPLTQDQLSGRLAARDLTLDRADIAKIEGGSRHVYDYELQIIAEVLAVNVELLLNPKK
jgi:hypothetical protein